MIDVNKINDDLNIDYGSTIDRTIPKGVKFNEEDAALTTLKCKILELMIEFASNYPVKSANWIYPKTNQILVDIKRG